MRDQGGGGGGGGDSGLSAGSSSSDSHDQRPPRRAKQSQDKKGKDPSDEDSVVSQLSHGSDFVEEEVPVVIAAIGLEPQPKELSEKDVRLIFKDLTRTLKSPPVNAESKEVLQYWMGFDAILKVHDVINEEGLPYSPQRRILLHKLITTLMHSGEPGLAGFINQIPAPKGEDSQWDYVAVKEAISKLIGYHPSGPMTLKGDLTKLKMQPNQTPSGVAADWRTLVEAVTGQRAVGEDADKVLQPYVDHLLTAFPDEWQERIIHQYGQKPTWQEVVASAERSATARAVLKAKKPQAGMSTIAADQVEEGHSGHQPSYLQALTQGRAAEVNGQEGQGPPPSTDEGPACWICGTKGHISPRCSWLPTVQQLIQTLAVAQSPAQQPAFHVRPPPQRYNPGSQQTTPRVRYPPNPFQPQAQNQSPQGGGGHLNARGPPRPL